MSKEEQNKIVPKWRFPEFNGPWNYLNGDELFDQISDKEHNSDLPILAITQEQGAIPRNLIDYHVSVTDKSVESYKVVQIGDFIISLRSFQGGIEYSEYEGLCSPAYIILRKKKDRQIVNAFYKHYFKSKTFIRDLNKNLEGIRDGKMVSYKQFSDIKNPYPDHAEQQKIADCLSSLDSLITAHTQKLDALKAHKKGLLQQLFPAEGEKVPRLRFAEFQDSGEWEEKKLENLCNKISDGIHTTPIYDEEGDFYFINGNNLIAGQIYVDEKTKRVSEQEYQKHKKELSQNSILLSINGTIGNIASYKNEKVVLGKSACYIN
ncbi:MAG: restriction endonuclease subunit S, partial [Chitinophagaceae bacterium]